MTQMTRGVPLSPPPVADEDRRNRLREQLPSLAVGAYFNTGRFGPLPTVVRDRVLAEVGAEISRGRGSLPGRDIAAMLDGVRERVRSLLQAPAGSIALTHNTTHGIALTVGSLRWQPDDEILTLTTEHESALAPLDVAAQRFGVRLVRVPPPDDPADLADAIEERLSPRSRLLAVSHVSWTTGARYDLAEIVRRCHRQGTLVIGDGAQAAGAIRVDVTELDVDFYAIPGQKWLLGPSGCGALYVHPRLVTDLLPGSAGFASVEDFDPESGRFDWLPDARRFEGATDSVPLRLAFGEALRWLDEDVGWAWAHDRIRDGVRRARELLADVPGVTVATPDGDQAGIVAFTVDGREPEQVVAFLAARDVFVRETLPPARVRACIGFFTTDQEIRALRDGLHAMARTGRTS